MFFILLLIQHLPPGCYGKFPHETSLLDCRYSITLLCIGAYLLKFAGGSLSDKPETWGQLGDYIGGLINPLAALLNVYVTIQIAIEVRRFGERQTQQQLDAQKELNSQQLAVQKELVKNELLHQILTTFKNDMLNAHASISDAIEENRAVDIRPAVLKAFMVINGFIKYYQSLFFVPPGLARSVAVEYQKWLVPLTQGLNNRQTNDDYDLKIRLNIDMLISLLYGGIIEEAKIPEPKPVPKEVMEYWEKKLAGQNPEPPPKPSS